MATVKLIPIDRPDVAPRAISERLRSQLVYFGSLPDGITLGEAEYFIASGDVTKWLDDGVLYLVSPLDTANTTEVELSEEQEDLLSWLHQNKVEHVRVVV